jgi:hypothetical protein
MLNLAPEFLTEAFWRAPEPWLAEGDASPEPIYTAVGNALNNWEMLESEMAFLFALLIESRSRAAFRAYGRLSSATARKEALEEAALIFFGRRGTPGLPSEIKAITALSQRASARRNEFAHGVASLFRTPDLNGWYLIPPVYNARKNRAFHDLAVLGTRKWVLGNYAYTSNQIMESVAKIAVCYDAISDYTTNLTEEFDLKPIEQAFIQDFSDPSSWPVE